MNANKPDISVIVAIYNVKDYLPKCLESILKQTLVNIEVILVNDGSTDNSQEICEAYANSDQRIKLINQANGGLYIARNTGLKHSSASYIYFMDGDDWIEPNLLKDTYSIAANENVDVVMFGHLKEMRLQSSLTNVISTLPPKVSCSNKEAVLSSMPLFFQIGCGFAVWEQLIKATCIKENNVEFPPYKRGTDMGFLLELYSHVSSLKSIQKAYYHYNAFNATNKFNPQLIETHVKLFKKYLSVFQKDRPFHFYTAQLFILWFAHVVPTNIIANKMISYREKISLLRSSFKNTDINRWTREYKINQAKGFVAKILMLMLKSGSPNLIYAITFGKNSLKNHFAVNYKKWFYR